MLAPAAILVLHRVQPMARSVERRILRREPGASQRGHREQRAVDEIDAPEAWPGAVFPLVRQHQLYGTADCLRHRRGILGDPGMQEPLERTDGRGSAFEIGQLGHALAEHFRRIEPLDEPPAAPTLVGAEAAIAVLSAENEPGGGAQAIGRDPMLGRDQTGHVMTDKNRGQGLGGAVADRPAMRTVAEAPTAEDRITMVRVAARQLFARLQLDEPTVAAPHGVPALGSEANAGSQGLERKARIPRRRPCAGVAGAFRLVLPEPAFDAVAACHRVGAPRFTRPERQGIQNAADRREPLIPGRPLLVADAIEAGVERAAPKPRGTRELAPNRAEAVRYIVGEN